MTRKPLGALRDLALGHRRVGKILNRVRRAHRAWRRDMEEALRALGEQPDGFDESDTSPDEDDSEDHEHGDGKA